VKESRIEAILKKCKAILKGHFILASGRHTGDCVDKFKIYENENIFSELCWQIAEELSSRFSDYSGNRIEAVVGPERGGKILARRIASYLQGLYRGQRVLVLSTKKDKKGSQVLVERDKKDIRGKKVLIVDDFLSTDGTLKQVISEIRKVEGIILGIAVVYRSSKKPLREIDGVPIVSVQLELEIEEFLAKKPKI